MSREEHTPGPWTWEAVGEHGYPQRIVGNDDGLVLVAETFYGGLDEAPHPNLTLICAAPDLLAALESIKHRVDKDPPNPDAMMAALDAIGNEARAAIAKATGSTGETP